MDAKRIGFLAVGHRPLFPYSCPLGPVIINFMEQDITAAGPAHVRLDRERCRGCLLCLDICPNELFVRDSQPNAAGALPALMQYQDYCINCMKCVAICPDQAFDVPVFPQFNLAGHVFGLSLRLHRLVSPHDR